MHTSASRSNRYKMVLSLGYEMHGKVLGMRIEVRIMPFGTLVDRLGRAKKRSLYSFSV